MSSFEVIKNKTEWKKLLSITGEYDFYHTWDYHELSQMNGEGEPFLLVYRSGSLIILLPLLERMLPDGFKDATSVYGYPGPVSNKKLTEDILTKYVKDLKNWGVDNKCISIFSRLNPMINNNIFDSDDFVVEGEGVIFKTGKTVYIDLNQNIDEQFLNYKKGTRYLVNKLRRDGYYCEPDMSSDAIKDFLDIYKETMNNLNAKDYYYFDSVYIEKLLNSIDFETKIYSCFYNGVKVCSGIFIRCGNIIQYHLSGSRSEFRKDSPTRLMLDTVRKDYSDKGLSVFHLGGGLQGKVDSLFDFKFGFSQSSLDFCVLKLVTDNTIYSKFADINLVDCSTTRDSFFPIYRK